jgi:hypothetical protein
MKLYLQLSDVGSGDIAVHENDAKSDLLDYDQMVRFTYRGADRGGFFAENFEYKPATTGDNTGRWVAVSGRGPLTVLDDGVVGYLAGVTTGNARLFADMTLAAMLIDVLTEAKTRGALTNVTWDFSDTLDSVGNAWGETQSLNITIGTTILDVVRQFASLGIDFYMGIDFKLRAFMLKGTDKSAAIIFRIGHNCQEVTRKFQTSELKNSFLIENPTGVYFEVNDLTSQTAYRRREALFNAGQAPDVTTAQRLAEFELAQRKDPRSVIAIRVIDTNLVTPEVFNDYDLGDYVGFDAGDGVINSYRVRGIMLEWTTQHSASVTLELSTPEIEMALRAAIKMRQLAPGSSGNVSPAAIPQDPSQALAMHNASASAHPNMVHDATKLQGIDIDDTAPSNMDALVYNLAQDKWQPTDLDGVLQPAGHHGTHEAGEDDEIKFESLHVEDEGTSTVALDVQTSGSVAKVGLYGATAVGRATTSGGSATFAQLSGSAVNSASTFDGYTLAQIVKALRDIGILT